MVSFRKRKRRSDVVVVKGRLRLYSASGFFLLLGLVILAAGIGMATLGYWPHSETLLSSKTQSGGSKTAAAAGGEKNATNMGPTAANLSTSDSMTGEALSLCLPGVQVRYGSASCCGPCVGTKQAAGALARFLEQHRHSERMKMLGPFTMGIGIFIFICANAILHENRDRETKVSRDKRQDIFHDLILSLHLLPSLSKK